MMFLFPAEKIFLDLETSVTIQADNTLWLTNELTKEEIRLSPQASYDLLAFLYEHRRKIYQETHRPVIVSPGAAFDRPIVKPLGDEGEDTIPVADAPVCADPHDPYIRAVLDLATVWARQTLVWSQVTRIVATEPEELPEEPEPAFVEPLRSWQCFSGKADRSWRCTIWSTHGVIKRDHLAVHLFDETLVTSCSEINHKTAPFIMYVMPDASDDDDEEEDHPFQE
jgi:hypothetical protein